MNLYFNGAGVPVKTCVIMPTAIECKCCHFNAAIEPRLKEKLKLIASQNMRVLLQTVSTDWL